MSRDADSDSLVGTVAKEAKKGVPRLMVALMTLLAALITMWSVRITVATDEAQSAARSGKAEAKKAKAEVSASYDDVKEKAESSGDTLAAAIERINKLEADVERLKAKAERRPRRKVEPMKVPPAVTEPLPPTTEAAAKEAAKE